MASMLSSLVSLLCMCLTQWLVVFTVAKPIPNGFSVDLIHRDSPLSPLYNPLETTFDRLYNAYNRSFSRINRFKPMYSKAFQSDIVSNGGEYFMQISIGTPPVSILGIADTGSDLTWVQCKPCDECYEQKSPLFDPTKSSTYKSVQCGTDPCNALDGSDRVCDPEKNTCKYSYSYGDRSFTKGSIALENFTIGPVSFPNLVFGCGHNNGGTFDNVGSGIVGLGGGPLSLVKQLGKSINGKFSYSLQAYDSASESSAFIFGTAKESNAVTSTTPLVQRDPSTYYYVTIEAVSVGDKRLPYGSFTSSSTAEKGNNNNIIIDSGTTLTFLQSEFYNSLKSTLEEAIKAERVSDPKGLLSPCFKADQDIDLPTITFHFGGGADVKLQPLNTFAQLQEDMVCFTMVPSNDIAIFGNLSQMNFLVSYDLEERTVSFTPTDYTNNH
ncbi:putative aspartic protease [Hibiscus syriacus]|uniref:Aspartic protease n=1 Tax=Hibiscus syriacus TaxID=106335 RepID=A0A6A2XYX5_HIBSY|nr:probable aspartic protease At2g35615 [Hibiscus syriacus]KAE8661927.1 putative aspartic protease [Hibiscus syriacus]